jgi:hypothetical protein
MKNKIFYFLTLILLTTLTGCEEPAEPTGIAFITFEKDSDSFIIDEGTTLNAEFKIYTATNVGSDTSLMLTVTSTLDAANYTVPATVTMPANTNEATVSISITENNLDKINGETLSISVASPDGFYSGATTLDITVNVFCPSQIAGSYVYSDGNGKAATIVADSGVNNFIISGDNAFGTDYAININDQCGIISVTGGEIQSGFGLAVSGTGTVMANGDIVLIYTAEGQFTNRTMTLVKQ